MKRVLAFVGMVFCFVVAAGCIAAAIALSPVDPDPGPGPDPGPSPVEGFARMVDEALDKDGTSKDQRNRLAGVYAASADLLDTEYAPETTQALKDVLKRSAVIAGWKLDQAREFEKVYTEGAEKYELKGNAALTGQLKDNAKLFVSAVSEGAAQ